MKSAHKFTLKCLTNITVQIKCEDVANKQERYHKKLKTREGTLRRTIDFSKCQSVHYGECDPVHLVISFLIPLLGVISFSTPLPFIPPFHTD